MYVIRRVSVLKKMSKAGYGFKLSATDSAINGGGDIDAFRIKIWDKDAFDSIVYCM